MNIRSTEILRSVTPKGTRACQGIRNVSFPENFVNDSCSRGEKVLKHTTQKTDKFVTKNYLNMRSFYDW